MATTVNDASPERMSTDESSVPVMSGAAFDRVLETLSEKPKFQNRIFLLLCLPAGLPSVLLGFSHFFVSATPKHCCNDFTIHSDSETNHLLAEQWKCNETIFRNDSLQNQLCSQEGVFQCNKWIYDTTNFEETLVSKFDLVCEKRHSTNEMTSVFYMGSAVGNLFLGWASDRWGRKKMLMPILFFTTVLPLSTIFIQSYEVYGIIRFLSGLFFPSIYQVPLILAMEFQVPAKRTSKGIIMSIWFAICLIIMSLVSYFAKTWINIILINSLPNIIFLSYYWIIPESPRWLLSKKRLDEAEDIIQRMAKVNGVKIPNNYLLKTQKENIDKGEIEAEIDGSSVYPWDIIRFPTVAMRYLIILYNWGIGALIYHGLAYYAAYLDINIFGSFALGGFVEIISCILAWAGMEMIGRKLMTIVSMFVGGLCCIATIFFEGNTALTVFFTMSGKLGCSTAFNVFYLYAAELLPTVVRSQAMSTASFVSSIVMLTLSSLLKQAESGNKSMILILFGVLSVMGGMSTIALPETAKASLLQTLEDAEAVPWDISCLSSSKKEYVAASKKQDSQ